MDIKKNQRRKNALARLEKAYEAFKAKCENKESWESTRNGKKHIHLGRLFNDECKRMATEIAILKSRIVTN